MLNALNEFHINLSQLRHAGFVSVQTRDSLYEPDEGEKPQAIQCESAKP